VKSGGLREERASRGLAGNPVRIVVDSRGRTPVDADILHKGPGERIIAIAEGAGEEAARRFGGLATVLVAGREEVDLPRLMALLHERGIGRLMVEGGGSLVASLFARGLVDEFTTFVGGMVIGGKDAPTPVDGGGLGAGKDFVRLELVEASALDGGVVLRWRVTPRP
jgi:2,5-diamino-6-(ribosylamino)-4(3H)-pyrimidinone 5'-phosphate reductase